MSPFRHRDLDAKTAIWVTADPRAEHQKVINWLNEATPEDTAFYLVRVEAIRIGSSPFAPLFTVLAGPDRQVKDTGEAKKKWADRHVKQAEFWRLLLQRSKSKTKLFSNIAPNKFDWIGTGAGKAGVTFNYSVRKDRGIVELYIDHDKDTGEGNTAIFDALYEQKVAIEDEFGAPLHWQRLDDKRACRITAEFQDSGLASRETWSVLHDKMIDGMIRLERAIRARLGQYQPLAPLGSADD